MERIRFPAEEREAAPERVAAEPVPRPESASAPGDSARLGLLALQRTLYRRQQRLVRAQLAPMSPALARYESRCRRRVRTFEREVTLTDVIAAAAQADVVHVGDYHTLPQAQRAYVRLVEALAAGSRPVALALEFVPATAQAALDRFLAGDLDEAAFRARLGPPDDPRFASWPNMQPVFEAARTLRLPVLALERRGGTLAQRDCSWARRIAQARRRRPEALVVVLAGQLHCAPPHLPAEVTHATRGPAPRQVVVYQNVDAISWRLAREGRAHTVEAVRIREGEFCLLNASPIVVQQSFLDALEDDAGPTGAGPAALHFAELARAIAGYLDLPIGDALDAVEVCTADDLGFLDRLRRTHRFSAREVAALRRHVLSGESCYVPRSRLAYLASGSLGHVAEEAAHFLRHVVTGHDAPPTDLVDAFYARALEEAFAFFASKLVNPRRRTPDDEDFGRLARTGAASLRRIARLVLAHRAVERGDTPARRRLEPASEAPVFDAVTHALGYMLGDRLYAALARGHLSKESARQLFVTRLDRPGAPARAYFRLTQAFP